MKFKSAKDLFNSKQQPTQSVDDFVAHMEKLAKFVGADEKMVLFADFEWVTPRNFNICDSTTAEGYQRITGPGKSRRNDKPKATRKRNGDRGTNRLGTRSVARFDNANE